MPMVCGRKNFLLKNAQACDLGEGVFPAVTVLTGWSVAFHAVITKFMYKICDDRMENAI